MKWSRVQTTVAVVHHSTDTHSSNASRLQTLAEDAERLLAAPAHQHVSLERELGQLRGVVTDLSQAPAELTQRVQQVEHVVEVRHANLAVVRRMLAALVQA